MMAYIARHLNSFDRGPLLIVLNNTLEDTICIQNIYYDEFRGKLQIQFYFENIYQI